AIAATDDRLLCKPISGTMPRSEVIVVGASDRSMVGACKHHTSSQVRKTWDLQWRSDIRVNRLHAIITLCAIQAQIVAQSQVQCELVSDAPVVLNESAVLETLRSWPDGNFVGPSPACRHLYTGQEAGH